MIDLFPGHLQPPPLQLSGKNVWLRPLHPDDWSNWAALRADSRDFLTPWEPAWPADSLTRAAWQRRLKRQYEEWRHDLAYNLLFFRTGDNILLGGLSLTNVRRGVIQTGTLGYWIGRSFTRQGYTSEAVRLVCEHAFGTLALHRLEASCLPVNLASQALLRKTGFHEEGLARGYLRINGRWEDHLLFGLTREEWTTP